MSDRATLPFPVTSQNNNVSDSVNSLTTMYYYFFCKSRCKFVNGVRREKTRKGV